VIQKAGDIGFDKIRQNNCVCAFKTLLLGLIKFDELFSWVRLKRFRWV